jgi:DNA polymerase-4
VLIEKVKQLFDKLYQKRMLIRMIGVKFSHLVQGNYQYNLFEDSAQQILLYQAMDKMRKRYGKDAIQRAVGLEIKHHDFNPFSGTQR